MTVQPLVCTRPPTPLSPPPPPHLPQVLAEAGPEGMRVEEIARRIQKLGLRDLRSSRTPEASVAGALGRDVLFARVAPATYALQVGVCPLLKAFLCTEWMVQGALLAPVCRSMQGIWAKLYRLFLAGQWGWREALRTVRSSAQQLGLMSSAVPCSALLPPGW